MSGERAFKLTLEYDGTGLAGWQRQADRPTVQGLVEEALAPIVGHPVAVRGAGRTDAGVHAAGQTADLQTTAPRTPAEIVRGGNSRLPPAVALVGAEEARPGFHARYDALSKVYDYDLLISPAPSPLRERYCWRLETPLDTAAMQAALQKLIGRRDFAAFQSAGSNVKTSVRTMIAAGVEERPEGMIRITLEADGFLRHMVRAVVGTLVMVGRSDMSPEEFVKAAASADRSRAGPTAPARGLCLRCVRYE